MYNKLQTSIRFKFIPKPFSNLETIEKMYTKFDFNIKFFYLKLIIKILLNNYKYKFYNFIIKIKWVFKKLTIKDTFLM